MLASIKLSAARVEIKGPAETVAGDEEGFAAEEEFTAGAAFAAGVSVATRAGAFAWLTLELVPFDGDLLEVSRAQRVPLCWACAGHAPASHRQKSSTTAKHLCCILYLTLVLY
jgi:hypothetical protein